MMDRYKTTFEDVDFKFSLEPHPNYQDIHIYTKLDLEDDDDLEHYEIYNVLINATYKDFELGFYLYGVYLEKDVESIVEELGEILDQQNILDQIVKEIKEVYSNKDNPSRVPAWGQS